MQISESSSISTRRRIHWLLLLVAAVLVAAACGGDDESDGGSADSGAASVTLASPGEGDTVTSPVTFQMEASNFTIEPAGDQQEGAGHFHLMIDVSCVDTGENIPVDDNHLHYGDASTTAEVELEPGEHTVCLQAGDGLHFALDLTDTVTFTVEQ